MNMKKMAGNEIDHFIADRKYIFKNVLNKFASDHRMVRAIIKIHIKNKRYKMIKKRIKS